MINRSAVYLLDTPAPILADILGVRTTTTTVRWVTYVRRDWTEYLAARAKDQQEQPTAGDADEKTQFVQRRGNR
jgi:hypothetical protein